MGLETATADHACNVVRRQIQDEFPDLTLLYIVYQDGQKQKAYETKRAEIQSHPAGEAFIQKLKTMPDDDDPEFSGISIRFEKKFLSFGKRKKALACFWVDAGKLESADDAKRHALFLAWHALALLDNFTNDESNTFLEKDGLILQHHENVGRAWKNMLADAFSVLLLEMEKRRDAIGVLGRERSQSALTAKQSSSPEDYPFPLVYDATRMLYQDIGKSPGPGGPVRRALDMTKEIGETFDKTSVRQWWAFCKPAQDMAWLGVEANTILGAAVYSSDEPYARATAYLVAEALNIQNIVPATSGFYNAFADSETIERQHTKACDETFRNVTSKANVENNSNAFTIEAQKQNKKLITGLPVGWCAYPLFCAEIAYRTSSQQAATEFQRAAKEVTWTKIQDVMKLIVLLRQEGTEVTTSVLAEKLSEIDDLKFLAPCFAARTA